MMVKLTKLALAAFVGVALLALSATADVYMANPGGSNNRCDEQSNNRNTANRLFNSQNNAAGGNAVAPPMYYYSGSILQLQWTNQHACGGVGSKAGTCNVVWQYACDESFKNGLSQDPTGDDGGNTCTDQVTEDNYTDEEVGMHESLEYFDACNARQRNKGLFAADQNPSNNQGAQATRQNPGGGKSGFECQEERDYYPYWHPTPWKDVAVMTNDRGSCDYYKAESANVKDKNYCSDEAENNKADCVAAGGQWLSQESWKERAPDCLDAPWSRDNQLGSVASGELASYNWTIPSTRGLSQSCVLRMRYNISSADVPWDADAKMNGDQSPVQDDPYITFKDMKLRLAINTQQFSRTFEDRSHTFEIRNRGLRGLGLLSKVWNLNVRGKRGNIAQVRNCVEYDFVPSRLMIKVGDIVHFQWTGSNHNNNNNAGEGRNRWDRSNIVQMIDNNFGANYFEPIETQKLFQSESLAYRMAFIDQDECDPDPEESDNDQATDNCSKLNANPTGYFDGGLVRMNRTGTFHYMSTRNNNFSNRGQKGVIIVRLRFLRYLLIAGIVAVGLVGVGAVSGRVHFKAAGLSAAAGAGAGAAGAGAASRRSGRSSQRRSYGSSGSGVSSRSKGSKSSYGGSMI